MKNKKILITGGTGSLGKALISRIKKQFPNWKIIIFSRDEGKQALSFGGDPSITRIIGDVRDLEKVKTSFMIHKPDYVIHTAALKRVDDMEFYPDECVKTNIDGSRNIAIAAMLTGVEKCMLISTDKACQPVNVYGSSKFIAERIFTNFDYTSSTTIFSSVRYGNVIASRGSFIPLWIKLIEEKKKIKVTSLDMTRFLFTLDDAVETVLSSMDVAQGGEVFIPSIASYSLGAVIDAVKEITGGNVEHDIVGLRPGEKMHEDMLAKTELPYTFEVPAKNLLCVRPQYSNRDYTKWKKYGGLEFNSSLHLSSGVDELAELIKRGLNYAK